MKKKTRKRQFIKADLKRFLRLFKSKGFKNGDLVLSATVYRVLDKDYGRKNWTNGIEVATVWPPCEVCSKEGRECIHPHILHTGKNIGDFGAMKVV